MKILMVNKFLYSAGGTETYMFKLGEELKKTGHQVQYFGMEHPDNCVGNDLGFYTQNMDFHSSGIKKFTYALKTVYSSESRKKIFDILENFDADIVHLNNFNYQLTPSVIYGIIDHNKKRNKNTKILYTAHDYQLVCPNHMMNIPATMENCDKCLNGNYINCIKQSCIHSSKLKSIFGAAEGMLYRRLHTYKFIDKVICCSEFMEKQITRYPVFKGKTVAMHNFIASIPHRDYEKEDYVLYFGRFSKEKGIETLIKCAENLPDIKFIFAGSGPLEDKINSLKNVTNVGFQSGDALNELIAKAKFSIYPSEWYENCPFSIMESISMSTPVIASDIGGIPELVINGENGLLFESKNVSELTESIKKLWSDNNLLAKLQNGCTKTNFDSVSQYAFKYINMIEGM